MPFPAALCRRIDSVLFLARRFGGDDIALEIVFNERGRVDLRHVALHAVMTGGRGFRQDLAVAIPEVAVADLGRILFLGIRKKGYPEKVVGRCLKAVSVQNSEQCG